MKKLVIVLGIVLIGLADCGKSEKENIVGKWREVGGTQIIEFFKDGTVIVKDKGDPTLAGDYRFLDDNRIRMNLALFGPITAEISSSLDEIILTNPFGKIEKYRRWKKSEEEREKKIIEEHKEEKGTQVLAPRPELKPSGISVGPVKETPAFEIAFSHGVFQIGDFSVALSSVEREPSRANLQFAITRVKDTDSEIEPVAITLTDDHRNNYYGTFDVSPCDDFPLHLLPAGFTYVKTASIVIPKAAPIETIQLESTEKIAFKKLKLVKPQFKTDFGKALLRPGESVSVGEFLSFTIDGIAPDLYTWVLSTTIENKDYNELRASVQCAVQVINGEIAPYESLVAIAIPGLSKKTSRLKLRALRGRGALHLSRLLILYCDRASGQTILRLWPITAKNLPPRVGQGINKEEIFVRAYQRNGSYKAIGDPLGLPYWFAGNTKPKDEFDVFVQEFPTSVIIWDKQNYASKAYVLYGSVLKKYQEPEIYRNLGPPTSDLKSWESSFGTKGDYCTFENGVITRRAGQTLIVMGKIYKKWKEENFIRGPLGFPVDDEKEVASGVQGSQIVGWVQRFEGGSIYCITKGEQAGRVFEISGNVAKTYHEMEAEASWLGFPVTEVYQSLSANPYDQAEFEGGYIGSQDGQKWEAFPYETGKVVFVSNRDSNKEIYVMDANGKNQINLTNNPADDWDPSWSPDGKRIAFVSNRDGNPEIYVMSSSGNSATRLTNNDAEDKDPSWFPDGSKIIFSQNPKLGDAQYNAFWGGTEDRIFVMNADGSGQKKLTLDQNVVKKDYALEHYNHNQPAVSPDGKKIVFRVEHIRSGHLPVLYTLNLDGTNLKRFFAESSRKIAGYYDAYYEEPTWSPDIQLVACNASFDSGIYLVNSDGSGLKSIYEKGKFPFFSPDGKRIVFSHDGEICIMDITGSLGRKITKDTEEENWDPSWIDVKQKNK